MIDQISSQMAALSRVQNTTPSYLDAAKPSEQQVAPETFTAMISQMITDTTDAVQKAEATSISAIHGKASVQEVAESVMEAEQALKAAIAVRDKVTSAYLELSRMGI